MAIEAYRDGRYYSTHKWHQNISIEVVEDKKTIEVTFKRDHSEYEDTIKRDKVGVMTSQQKLDFIEDCLNKFIRDERRSKK